MSETATENGQAVEEVVGYYLPTQLAIAVLNYLAKRPYEEVIGLIAELQALMPVDPRP